jgi:hypothetical protein
MRNYENLHDNMEITRDNIGKAIQALRKCAAEHKAEVVPTFGIVTYAICEDVADYLEKIKGMFLIEMPSEEECTNAADEHIELCSEECFPYQNEDEARAAFCNGIDWLKSKIVK